MTVLTGFPPIVEEGCRVLILGSMPSAESLRQQQYYAHPRNAFWPIMEKLFSIPRESEYVTRTRLLGKKGVAVWDVLQSCVRPGSLDSAIEAGSEILNDFSSLHARYPGIRTVFFNGGAAQKIYRRYVPGRQTLPELEYHLLPSTSPAYAAMSFEKKLQRWQSIIDALARMHD
jgi:TDG/mug DNA glycosylase family protein